MSHRYNVAKAMGPDSYARAIKEDEELLETFGLKLLSVDGGIRAAVISEIKKGRINPWNVVTIEMRVWDMLRPQLVELQSLREARQPTAVAASK